MPDDDLVAEAVEYVTHVADSGPASAIPLRPDETLHQCSKCGRRTITTGSETPANCACDGTDREWIAVRSKNSDPDPMAAAVVDVTERWPINSDGAREFLMDVGYTPPRGGRDV